MGQSHWSVSQLSCTCRWKGRKGTLPNMMKFPGAAIHPEYYQRDTHEAILEQGLHLWQLARRADCTGCINGAFILTLDCNILPKSESMYYLCKAGMYAATWLTGWLCSCSRRFPFPLRALYTQFSSAQNRGFPLRTSYIHHHTNSQPPYDRHGAWKRQLPEIFAIRVFLADN